MDVTVDYYAALELSRSPPPTTDDIQAAYRRLARTLHPDRNPSPDATAQFQAVQKAYECLKDPHARELYDQYGAESEQYTAGMAEVAKTRFGKWMLSDWRWTAGVMGWILMGYLNRNWLYFPLHWLAPAAVVPFFGPGFFVAVILDAAHYRRATLIGHSSAIALSALLQTFVPLSWLTFLTRIAFVLCCIGAGIALKDDRDIPLVLFILSFFSDIYGKQHNNFFNRTLGVHALLSFITVLLSLRVLIHGPRYPRRSYLFPALSFLTHRIFLPILAFIIFLLPPFVSGLLFVLMPVYILNQFFSFPVEWLALIIMRVLLEFSAPTLRRMVSRFIVLIAVFLTWFFLVPTRFAPSLLNALLYSYLVRQSCAFFDTPDPRGHTPSAVRLSSISLWLLLLAIDFYLRTLPTTYPIYSSITAAFAVLATFGVVPLPPPDPSDQEPEQTAKPKRRRAAK